MPLYDRYGQEITYRGGGQPTVHLKITTPLLSRLFKCSERTIWRWIKLNRLDPSNLLDIIDKYNNPQHLDYRRKK